MRPQVGQARPHQLHGLNGEARRRAVDVAGINRDALYGGGVRDPVRDPDPDARSLPVGILRQREGCRRRELLAGRLDLCHHVDVRVERLLDHPKRNRPQLALDAGQGITGHRTLDRRRQNHHQDLFRRPRRHRGFGQQPADRECGRQGNGHPLLSRDRHRNEQKKQPPGEFWSPGRCVAAYCRANELAIRWVSVLAKGPLCCSSQRIWPSTTIA